MKQGGIKDIALGRSDIYRLAPHDLHVKEGWNSREADDPSNVEHVDQLARMIAESGVKEPLTVYWEDGKAIISDGHCRHAATFRAIEVYGADIKSVPVKTEDRYANEADRTFSQIVRNSGKQLTPFEQGKVFLRLLDFGWTEKDIAYKAGRSATWVTECLRLQAQPEAVKSMIRSGVVSAHLANSVAKETGDDAKTVETLNHAVETAKAAGKERATAKHVGRPNPHAELKAAFGRANVERTVDTVVIRMSTDDYARVSRTLKLPEVPAALLV